MRSDFSQTQCEYFWNGAFFVGICKEVEQDFSFPYFSAITSGLLLGGAAYVATNKNRSVQFMNLLNRGAEKIQTLYLRFFEKKVSLEPIDCKKIIHQYFEGGFQKITALEHLLIRGLLPKEVKLVNDFYSIFQGAFDCSEAVQREVAEAIVKICEVKEQDLLNSSKAWDLASVENMMESLGLQEPLLVLKQAHPGEKELLSFGPWSIYSKGLNLVNEKRAQIELEKFKEANKTLISEIKSYIPREKREITELLFRTILDPKPEGVHDFELVLSQEDVSVEIERICLERSKLDAFFRMYTIMHTPLNKAEEVDCDHFFRSLVSQIKDPIRGKEIFSSMGLGQIFITTMVEEPDLLSSDKNLLEWILGLHAKGAQVCGW